MRELFIMPAVGLIILGFLIPLAQIAEDTSQKALVFASDMNGAMDCAANARPLSECSPALLNRSFKSELNDTVDILYNMTEYINGLNKTYHEAKSPGEVVKFDSSVNELSMQDPVSGIAEQQEKVVKQAVVVDLESKGPVVLSTIVAVFGIGALGYYVYGRFKGRKPRQMTLGEF